MPLFLVQQCEYDRIWKKERQLTKMRVSMPPRMNAIAIPNVCIFLYQPDFGIHPFIL